MRKMIIPAVLLLLLTGCGAGNTMADTGAAQYTSGSAAMDSAEGIYEDYDSAAVNGGDESGYDDMFSYDGEKRYDDKLVYTCSLSIETLDYDSSIKSIKEKVKQADGFIAAENEYDDAYGWYYADYVDAHDRRMDMEVRVPSDKYEGFLASLDGDGKVVSRSSSVDNISRQYYDTEAVIESLKVQEERLLGMMDAAETIEDMVTVEKRLTEVQTQLNQYRTSLSVMQSDVDYSTVHINVSEVYEYTPDVHTDTFFDRLRNTVSDAVKDLGDILEGLLFFLILLVPRVLVYGPVILLIFIAVKKIRAKARHKKENQPGGTKSSEEKTE